MFDFPMTDPLAGLGDQMLGLNPALAGGFPQLHNLIPQHGTLLGSAMSAATGGMLGNKGQGGGGLLQATGNSAGGLLGGSFNVPGVGSGMLTMNGGLGGAFNGHGFGSMAPGGLAQFPGGYQAPADTLNLPF